MSELILTSFLLAVLFSSGNCQFRNNLVSENFLVMDDKTNFDEVDYKFKKIFPGTKWCGPGNIAKNDDDLGIYPAADKCCREHDHCPDSIPSGESKYGLPNLSGYTRKSCECDDAFRECLKTSGSTTATLIGQAYFTVLGTKCFKKDFPIVGCKHNGGLLNKKCVEYAFDKTKEKIYQWFHVAGY